MLNEDLRKVAYKTFAKLFYYPDKEVAEFLFNGIISALFAELNFNDLDDKQFANWLNKFDDENTLLESIQIEYTRLFINSFPTLPAPPFKSFYIEKELIGASTGKIVDKYEQFNFGVSKDTNELADSIGVELEFIYRLIEENSSLSFQYNFIREEILSWIKTFKNKIIESASIPYFPYLINQIIRYLEEDIKQYEKLTGAEL